jgi:hypothetical protein
MANNEVKFSLKIEDNATGTLKDVSASTKDLGRVVKSVTEEVRRTQRTIVDWTQSAQAADMLGQTIRQIEGACRDLVDSYQIQLVAETQLQTVMRQRMRATEADIQSVKDLCGAQQQLGVIGDEVQLSGAQQMATFLGEKESLDALIPAMNNLLAQQKGLNATNQDAVSIGNMMGKALQGQVDVLQRVGITFTEAQKQVLKYGSEAQRAATLADVIRDNVGEMNAELARTDAGKQKQLENTLGDIKEQLGAIVQPMMQNIIYASKLSIAFSSLVKAGATVRSLNETLGVTRIATYAYRTSVTSLNAMITVLRARLTGAAVGATTLKVALRGLLVSTGVGAALAALAFIMERLMADSSGAAGAMRQLTLAQQQAQRAQEAYTQAASQARADIDMEAASLQTLIKSKADQSAKVTELNRKYGDTFGRYKTAAEWYDVLTQKSAAYCQAIGYEAQARSIAAQVAENELKLAALRDRRKQMEASGAHMTNVMPTAAMNASSGAFAQAGRVQQVKTEAYHALRLEEARLVLTNSELKKSFDRCTESMRQSATAVAEGDGPIEAASKEAEAAAGSIAQLEARLRTLTEQQRNAPVEQQLQLTADIVQIEDTIQALRSRLERAKFTVRFHVKADMLDASADGPARSPISDAMQAYVPPTEPLQAMTSGLDSASGAMDRWDEAMRRARESGRQTMETVGAMSSTLSSIGQAVDGQTGQWLQWGAGVLNAVATALPQITALTMANEAEAQSAGKAAAAEAAKSVAGIPFLGPAMAVAAVASIVAALASIPKFAQGAIAYGPTLGLFGEYAGAANNPEVVAPLDRLRSLIRPAEEAGLSGDVRFRIDGDVLEGLLERRNRRRSRT